MFAGVKPSRYPLASSVLRQQRANSNTGSRPSGKRPVNNHSKDNNKRPIPNLLSFYDSEEEKIPDSLKGAIRSVHDVLSYERPNRVKKRRSGKSVPDTQEKTQSPYSVSKKPRIDYRIQDEEREPSIPAHVLEHLSDQLTPGLSTQFSTISPEGPQKKINEYSEDSVKPLDEEKDRFFLQLSPERPPYNPLQGSAEKVFGSAERLKPVGRKIFDNESTPDTDEEPLQQYMFNTGTWIPQGRILKLSYMSFRGMKILEVNGFDPTKVVQKLIVAFPDGQKVPVFFKRIPLGQDAQRYQDQTDDLYGTSRAVNPIVQTVTINFREYLIQQAFACDFQEFTDLKLESQAKFNEVVLHKVGQQLLRLIVNGKSIHGDVKPQNIVLRPNGDEDFQVRFIDTEDTTQRIQKEDSRVRLTTVTPYYIHSGFRRREISEQTPLLVDGVSHDLYAFFKMVKDLCPWMLRPDVCDSDGEILSSLTKQNLLTFLKQESQSCGAIISYQLKINFLDPI